MDTLERVILFDENENYLGDLNVDAIDTTEIEGLDGESRLLFDYPLEQSDVDLITEGCFIAIPDLDGTDEEYLLFEVVTLSQNDLVLRAECTHDYYNLGKGELVSWNTNADAPLLPLTTTLERERWQVGTVTVNRALKRSVKHNNPLESIRYIEAEWGGEIKFRITITGSYNINRYVDHVERRGVFVGNRFEFGHNLQEFSHIIETGHIITASYGFGKAPEGGTDTEGNPIETEPITFANTEWSIANGDPTDKPLGQIWVGDEAARLAYGRPDGNGGKLHKFKNYNTGESETEDGLLWESWRQVQLNNFPLINITGKVTDLGSIDPKFSHERARLGDDHFIIADVLGKPVELKTRIIKFTRRRKEPTANEVELGNFLPTASNQIVDIQKKVDLLEKKNQESTPPPTTDPNAPIEGSRIQGLIDLINVEMRSSLGHVYYDEQGILILNAPKDQNPTKAMLLSGGAFFLSNEKDINGEWNWRTFGDGDGFIADELVAGTIRTDLIEIVGDTNFKWNDQNIYILDPADSQKQIRIGKYDGVNYGISFTKNGGADWNVALSHDGLQIKFDEVQGLSDELQDKITSVQVGAVNLVRNSTWRYGTDHWDFGTKTYAAIIDPEEDRPTSPILQITGNGTSTFMQIRTDAIRIDADGASEYTLQFKIKINDKALVTGSRNVFYIRAFNDPNLDTAADSVWSQNISVDDLTKVVDGQKVPIGNDEWAYYKITIKPTSGIYLKLAPYVSGGTAVIKYREIKLETGNKDTAWTPANVDVSDEVNFLSNRVSSVEQSVSPEAIVSTVTSSESFQSSLNSKADASELGNYATNDTVDGIKSDLQAETDGKIAAIDFEPYATKAQLSQTSTDLTAKFSSGGGVNLIKNSIGFAGFDFWDTISGMLQTRQNQELNDLGFGSGFYAEVGKTGYIEQVITVTPDRDYTLSFMMRKIVDSLNNGWAGVDIYDANGVKFPLVGLSGGAGVTEGFQKFAFSFVAPTNTIKIRVTVGTEAVATITGLMLNDGTIPLHWTLATGELYNTNIRMDLNGIRVSRIEDGKEVGYTLVTPEEFGGYFINADGNAEKIFYLQEDETVSKKFRAKDEITMGTIKIVKVNNEAHANLLQNSDLEAAALAPWREYGTASLGTKGIETISDNAQFTKAMHLNTTAVGGFGYAQDDIPTVKEQVYVMSCYVKKVSGSGSIRFQEGNPTIGYSYTEYALANLAVGEWYRISHRFTAKDLKTNLYIGQKTTATTMDIFVTGLKFERGSVPSYWSKSLAEKGELPMAGWAFVPTTEIID